ncbi:UDP-glycosyltransferase 90A1-like [Cynara cardunculus var. scolymus]|uniref:UDP-glycosyltransferase 90A1-like n=1 Tax=Cynara cardunculus var. scolymus TaxID=59895 RepID=UPI000D62E44A|nr:UDP-glycosyltransferase 90A1-like [Cynara cardunculus var. scolymus]
MTTISSPPHFVLFPFMSQGHTIPLLHLSGILFHRCISVTIITTPANYASVRSTVSNDSISVIDIPFPEDIVAAPPGVQVTGKLQSMSSFINFVEATEKLQPRFEEVVRSLPPVSCIISDGFFSWTQDSADKLGIPRLVFYGNNIFSMTMDHIMTQFKPHATVNSDDEPFPVPDFPRFKLTVNDFQPPFSEVDPKGPEHDFHVKQQEANAKSHGMVVNSFYELEPEFIDYWNRNVGPKAWCIGPFCIAKPTAPKQMVEKPTWVEWLDEKLLENKPVIYVSFGTQAEVSPEQLLELAVGLEKSNVNFMWVLKWKQFELIGGEGFEERMKGRGKMVNEWVDQVEVLNHESVCGFLSHCGWNSVLESICAGVAVLAMPLMAEQHLNARMVVEEIGMGLRLWAKEKVARGLVGAEEVEKMVVELMEGKEGRRVKERVMEVKEGAYDAMKEGGSSWRTLESLIDHVCGDMHPLRCGSRDHVAVERWKCGLWRRALRGGDEELLSNKLGLLLAGMEEYGAIYPNAYSKFTVFEFVVVGGGAYDGDGQQSNRGSLAIVKKNRRS